MGTCAKTADGRERMRRNQFEIIAEILQIAKSGAKKTRIMYQCNLSHRMTSQLLNLLLGTGLLRTGNSYHTTEKGLQFLQAYQSIETLLNQA